MHKYILKAMIIIHARIIKKKTIMTLQIKPFFVCDRKNKDNYYNIPHLQFYIGRFAVFFVSLTNFSTRKCN